MRTEGITAHRGDSSSHPENTLAAFKAARSLGISWVETDIRLTLDQELVVVHDAHLKRLTGVDAKVRELRLKDIRQLKVSSNNGIYTIPTLKEVFESFRNSQTRISLQPKADCVDAIISLARSMSVEKLIAFNDHDREKMLMARRLLPNTPIFWDRLNTDSLEEDIELAKENNFQALVVYDPAMNQLSMDQIQSSGLEAGVWTVNEQTRWRELISWGIDRIYTDKPADLLRLISAG
jgi:glycerophosphoryl diester phosphodiesterase